jgi:hypothetical protein
VIRFYWGYRSADGEEGKYKIPLVNIHNEDYHQLLAEAFQSQLFVKRAFLLGRWTIPEWDDPVGLIVE